jgi:EAL domain-containing protein (putative c-di-GMP-specific phosphodiesterase class I)
MITTAEGVETQEQVEKVREEGCTEMQGFFFSPPKPKQDIERLFFAQNRQSASAA